MNKRVLVEKRSSLEMKEKKPEEIPNTIQQLNKTKQWIFHAYQHSSSRCKNNCTRHLNISQNIPFICKTTYLKSIRNCGIYEIQNITPCQCANYTTEYGNSSKYQICIALQKNHFKQNKYIINSHSQLFAIVYFEKFLPLI